MFEIPSGFTGWATVEYGVAAAPALPIADGARVIRLPASGSLKTSSPQELGIVTNQFYFVDAAGTRTPIDDVEGRRGAAPDEAARQHDHVVVLGYGTGDAADAAGHRVFERFYIGTGPAGDAPAPP